MRKTSEATYSSLDFEEDAPQAVSKAPARKSLTSRVLKRLMFGTFLTIGVGIVYNAVSLQDLRHQAPLFGKTATVAMAAKPVEASPLASHAAPKYQAGAPSPAPVVSAPVPNATVGANERSPQADAPKAEAMDPIAQLARASTNLRAVSVKSSKTPDGSSAVRKTVQSQARQKLLNAGPQKTASHKPVSKEAKVARDSVDDVTGTAKVLSSAPEKTHVANNKKQPDAIANLLRATH